MDGYLRQSTASQARLIGPFIDDTDFKTAETALTIANTDIKLRANGTTLANKNSGGGTHQVNGMYSVTWDATDTANVGELKYSVVVAGALQVFGSYTVLEEAVYDAMLAASAPGFVDGATVNATKIGGTTQTGRDIGASVLLSSGTGAGQLSLSSGLVTLAGVTHTGAVIPTVTTLTGHTAQTGDCYARLGAPAGASVSADVAAVKADTAATLVDTAEIGVAGAGLTALASAANLATVAGYVDTEVAAIKAVTDNLPDSGALTTLGIGISNIEADTQDIQSRIPAALTAGGNIKTDVLAMSGSTTAATNLRQGALGVVNVTCGAGSTTTVIKTTLTETTDDHYIGRVLVFLTGDLAGQATTVTDYDGTTKQLTVDALTEAPADTDTAVMV